MEYPRKLFGKPTRLYTCWRNMRYRCYRTADKDYHNYGGRGVRVYEPWRDHFPVFARWAVESGYQSNLTLDRIDPRGDYEPTNCRWVTRRQQSNNRRNSRWIEYRGVRRTVADWARLYGLPTCVLYRRVMVYRWPMAEALTTPVGVRGRNRLSKAA
jgi:hypothetical protein